MKMEQIMNEKAGIVVDILGTPYFVKEDTEALKLINADGECQAYSKTIRYRELDDFLFGVASLTEKRERRREVIRHEIVHAFFHESGLEQYSDDEVLVAWIALQFPKISRAVESILEQLEDK